MFHVSSVLLCAVFWYGWGVGDLVVEVERMGDGRWGMSHVRLDETTIDGRKG